MLFCKVCTSAFNVKLGETLLNRVRFDTTTKRKKLIDYWRRGKVRFTRVCESGSRDMKINEIARETERMVKEGHGEYIRVNGINIRYRVRGSGFPVVLLHGLGGFLEMWWLNVVDLSSKYKVYAVDLPGHGLSDRAANSYDLDSATEYASGVVAALGLKQVNLIGHSMGGAISANLAAKSPGLIQRLVLVNSAGLTAYVPLRFRTFAAPFWGALLMKLAERVFYRTGIRYLFYDKQLANEIVQLFVRSSGVIWPKEAVLNLSKRHLDLKGVRRESLVVAKLPLIQCPTLFVHGAQDPLVPLNRVKDSFRLVNGATVRIIEECGHFPQVEQATAPGPPVRPGSTPAAGHATDLRRHL